MTEAEENWRRFSRCTGYFRLFFAEANERPQQRARREESARRICASCVVRMTCREAGRANAEYGVWGGENEEERVAAGVPVRDPIGRRSARAASG
jgi:WhiB family transcriptional regulator, redox-sensing transcriptional regulator